MGEKNHILIIDDEKDFAEMISLRLEANGYQTTIALNGKEGLEKLKLMTPDLIILDLNMPEMGGVEFYHKICDEHSNPKYPVFIFTAKSQMKDFFKNFSIAGFIAKPYDPAKLLEEIDLVFKAKDATQIDQINISQKKKKSVLLADSDPEKLLALSVLFERAGYKVSSASNAVALIISATVQLPALALIDYHLDDISGDIAILRLKEMAKTKDIDCLLYMHQNFDINEEILMRLQKQTGVTAFVEYKQLNDLVDATNKYFRKIAENS